MNISFRVAGLPRPKGSLRPVGRRGEKARLIEQVDPKGEWRGAVKRAALAVMAVDHQPFEGPLQAELIFYFPAPKRPRHGWPTTRTSGDVDKLQRNVFDALQVKTGAGLIKDDSQVVHVSAQKRWAASAEQVGVDIALREYAGRTCCICSRPSADMDECAACAVAEETTFKRLEDAA